MKTRFPLFAKFLAWFFLNVLIVGAALVFFFRDHLVSLDQWLLPNSSRERIQAMSVLLIDELTRAHTSERDAVLARFSKAYQMQFALFDQSGARIAGANLNLPPRVQQHFSAAVENATRRELPEEDFGPPIPRPAAVRGEQKFPENFPTNVVHTSDPSSYWLFVRLPPEALKQPPGAPWTLVGMTQSLAGSTLLFDPKPVIFIVAGVLIFCVIFWLPLARHLTRSLAQMTRAAESIADGKFDVHIPDDRGDELGRLAAAINRMTSKKRLAGFVMGQKRFLGDVAHELCSPLARMEMALGILEQNADENSREFVEDVREEVRHMSSLINQLLSFSKASLGANRAQLQFVHLREIIDDAVSRERTENAQIETHVAEQLTACADPDLLRRAVANLLRNAIRYAASFGPITINAARQKDAVLITVADCGSGVPPDALEKLFEPFFRTDAARTRESGGAGLGLAIVKSCIEACDGVVTARNRKPRGFEVTIALQASRPKAAEA